MLIWGTIVIARGGYIGLLDKVNLIWHEAGHTLFVFFGDFVRILGGSLTQVLIPLLCGVVFLVKRQWFASTFALWWAGQNLTNVSIYIGDARALKLDLIGGEASIHDWNYLLGMMGQRHLDMAIASYVWWIGMIAMGAALFLTLYFIWRDDIKTKKGIAL